MCCSESCFVLNFPGRLMGHRSCHIVVVSWLVSLPPPGPRTPPEITGLIAGLIKGKKWLILIIRPAISGGGTWPGG